MHDLLSKQPNERVKVALIELYPYHSELIFSQLLFLSKSNCEVTLIVDKENRVDINILSPYTKKILTFDFKKFNSFIKLRREIVNSKINHLVFNTAQGNRMLKFSLFPLPQKIIIAGLIHNTDKLSFSLGQKIISRKIKSYFVLASYMQVFFPSLKNIKSTHINCSYRSEQIVKPTKKKAGDIWLGVPGSVEYKRRDYSFLLDLVKNEKFPKNVKIILLGNASKFEGPILLNKIKELGKENNFLWFNQFVEQGLFDSYMESIDYLLPLIHPSTPSAKAYLKNKVSGTFIQSKTYSKPMLIHKMFDQDYFDYDYYSYSSVDDLTSIICNKIEIPIKKIPKFEEDRKAYSQFLGIT